MMQNSIFNKNFQEILVNGKNEKLKEYYLQVISSIDLSLYNDSLLSNGIKIAILKSILTSIGRGLNPLAKEIIPEYNSLVSDVCQAYSALLPTAESDWLQECIAFGDKTAYHWEWKHFGSKELY